MIMFLLITGKHWITSGEQPDNSNLHFYHCRYEVKTQSDVSRKATYQGITSRSISEMTKKKAMPSREAMIISDQTSANLLSLASSTRCTPRLLSGPPKYSLTIAAIMLSDVATLSALKIKGSADGIRTLRK